MLLKVINYLKRVCSYHSYPIWKNHLLFHTTVCCEQFLYILCTFFPYTWMERCSKHHYQCHLLSAHHMLRNINQNMYHDVSRYQSGFRPVDLWRLFKNQNNRNMQYWKMWNSWVLGVLSRYLVLWSQTSENSLSTNHSLLRKQK